MAAFSTAVYRPVMSVDFFIRFDEVMLSKVGVDISSPADLVNGDVQPKATGKASTEGDIFQGPDGYASHIFSAIPLTAGVELPGYRQAGKYNLTFAFRDMPFDPRTIRALAVKVYLGCVTVQEWADSMEVEGGMGTLQDLVKKKENLVITGLADDIGTDFGDKGSTLKIEGRDYRGLFLDAKVSDPTVLKKLKLNKPIDEVVRQLFSYHPLTKKMPVESVAASFWPDSKIPLVGSQESVTRINKGANGQQVNQPVKGEATGLSYWDVVTNFCFLVGAIPYFDGQVLTIRPVRSLYDQQRAGVEGNPTPFDDGKPRTVQYEGADSEQLLFRRMVYGRNIEKMTVNRKLGGLKVPTVRCVSTDTGSKDRGLKRLIEARFPPEKGKAVPKAAPDSEKNEAATATDVAPDGTAKEEIVTVAVPGVQDKKTLLAAAQAIYEEIGRGELKGSISTKDLASFGGGPNDADLLRLRPGDAVQLLVDAAGTRSLPAVVSDLNNLESMSMEKAVEAIAKRFGGDKKIAKVIAFTAQNRKKTLQDIFRVNTVKFSWGKNGVGVDFDFHNFIEARSDLQAKGSTVPPNTLKQRAVGNTSVGGKQTAPSDKKKAERNG